jgi:hypothetical protein
LAKWRDAVGLLHIKETVLSLAAKLFDSSYRREAPADADLGQFLSLIVVDVGPDGATAVPVILEDLNALVNDQTIPQPIVPADSTVLEVWNPMHRLSDAAVDRCLRHDRAIRLF